MTDAEVLAEALDLLRTIPPDMELLHGEEYAKAEAWWDRREALLSAYRW